MKLPNFFRKTKQKEKTKGFSEFFHHASPVEKIKVFTEAARRANEEQLEVFTRSQLKKNPS